MFLWFALFARFAAKSGPYSNLFNSHEQREHHELFDQQ